MLDYLLEEVLARQPAAIQRFLLHTSILNRMCGPLCDAVTGAGQGAATLLDLLRQNLFVVPLDEERFWFRYHHLFAELLRARLHQVAPDAGERAPPARFASGANKTGPQSKPYSMPSPPKHGSALRICSRHTSTIGGRVRISP